MSEHLTADESMLMDEDTQRIIDKVEKENKSRKNILEWDIQRIKKEEYDRGFEDGLDYMRKWMSHTLKILDVKGVFKDD